MNGKAYDVAILGTGFGGNLLGAILAASGARVLLVDRGQHPRFAIGESTIPQTSMMLRLLAARYGVEEIEHCSHLAGLMAHVGSSCGVKRNFGFVYHRSGEPQRPAEVNQTVIPEFAHGPESHLFRQDVDAFTLVAAIRRGAAVRQKTNVTEIEIDGRGVRLATEKGETLHARFLVDGAGFRSPLARKHGLREEPVPLETHSRTLFTHMVDVAPYEECTDPPGVHAMPRRWSQGTLHHLFAGGWLWVIPFNNHEAATNPLVSVGLTLDPRTFPKGDEAPAEEFARFLQSFPSLRAQFAKARPVREWVSTGRLQYCSKRSVGERFCLLSHSSGFVDALFSRGLANTTELINALAWRLIAALEDGDFSPERFAPVDLLQRRLIHYNDRLVHCSFVAFSDFELWNAWHRVWVVGAFLGWLRLTQIHERWKTRKKAACFDDLETRVCPGALCPGVASYDAFFDAAASEVEKVAAGSRSPGAAARAIFELLRGAEVVPPVLALGDPDRLHTPVFDHGSLLELFGWLKKTAPAEVRAWYAPGS